MCGIAGIIGAINDQPINNMVKAMHHRGPDDNGIWNDADVYLGMTRLAIIDLSPMGHQPMISACGRYVLIFNGEVYNFKEERGKLEEEGYQFRSHSDTEVVMNLFVKYRERCVEYLRGMFAFAVWDIQDQSLFVARDHLGIKPLLYYYNDNKLIFCSEMKGMLASGQINRKLSTEGLSVYLQKGFIAPPYSAINKVFTLEAGHCFTWKRGAPPEIRPYWDLTAKGSNTDSYELAIKNIREKVLNSVSEELVSDVPLGVFLSGGMDSSIILAAMRILGKSSISTFSIGFNSDYLDETLDAAKSAEYFGANHNKIIIGEREIADSFDSFIYAIDQPSVDGLNSFLVSKAAKQNVTVALSGLGGDEVFMGYSWQHKYYKNSTVANLLGGLLAPFESPIVSIGGSLGKKVKDRFIDFSDVYRYYENIHLLYKEEFLRQAMPQKTGVSSNALPETIRKYSIDPRTTRLQQVAKMDLQYYMSAMLLRDSDAVAMANSLEVRFPLIDYRLVEYVWNLPDNYKINHNLSVSQLNKGFEQKLSYRDGGVKKLLFEAFKKDLPSDFDKRSKRGFKMPFEKWMRGLLAERVTGSFTKLSEQIFTKEASSSLLNDWNEGRMTWNRAWSLVVLQEWMEQNDVYA